MDRKKIEVKYNQFANRIEKIKKHFDFTPGIDGLTALQNDKIRGFVLLCHAEIESYLEELALLLIDDAHLKWRNSHKANYNLASLFIDAERIEKNETALTKSEQIIFDYRSKVEKNNHGIREKNIKSLFCPLGYKIDDFDASFIATLDSFGTDRGKVAHSAARTSYMYDKQTEYERIDSIVTGIRDFQEILVLKVNR